MKKLFLLILMASSFSYSSPCKDTVELSTENEALKSVEQALKDPDVKVRLGAFKAWLEVGESAHPLLRSQGIPVLREAMESLDEEVQMWAVRLLKIVEPAHPLLRSQGIPILRKALENPNIRVQIWAVDTLVSLGESVHPLLRSQGIPVLRKALESLVEESQLYAISVLMKMGELGLPLLEEKFLARSNIRLQLQGVNLLVQIGEPARDLLHSKGLPIVEQALRSSDLQVIAVANRVKKIIQEEEASQLHREKE